MGTPSKACTSSRPLDIYGQCTVAVTNEFVLARGAANRDQQYYSLKEPPAIRFYPQRLPTTHVPSQDNHAAGVREVSEHTVCIVREVLEFEYNSIISARAAIARGINR